MTWLDEGEGAVPSGLACPFTHFSFWLGWAFFCQGPLRGWSVLSYFVDELEFLVLIDLCFILPQNGEGVLKWLVPETTPSDVSQHRSD